MTTMLAATVVHCLGTAAGVVTGMLIAARSEADGKCAMWPAWTMGIWFFSLVASSTPFNWARPCGCKWWMRSDTFLWPMP